MRTTLRIAALVLGLVMLGFWCLRGADPGWTKTSVPHKQRDPVTELEVNIYEPRFVPGIDFLGGGLALAALMAGSSFLFRKPLKRTG